MAGLAIAKRWAVVMRGGKNPLSEDFNSNSALGTGVAVPMPTLFCAEISATFNKDNKVMLTINFFIF